MRCGAVSGGLVAAGFPDLEKLGAFIDQNPALKTSPITRWFGAPLLWLRTDFLASADRDLDEIVWIATGVAPLGWRKESVAVIDVFRAGEPQLVPYGEIHWPEAVGGVFAYHYLSSIYGPFFLRDRGRLILNLNLWAAWANDRLGLRFDTRHGSFRLVNPPSGETRLLSRQTVVEKVTHLLQCSAQSAPKQFPLHEIRPRRIQELVGLMEAMAMTSQGCEAEGLEQFLSDWAFALKKART